MIIDEFVSCCVPLIATIFPCNASRPGQDKSLGILVQLATFCPWTLRAQVGVEPIAFYCFGPSKKPRQRDFLLLTLTKLGGSKENRTPINGVTSHRTDHYTMKPNLVETVGIEPTVFLMSLIYSQLPSPLGTHLRN